MNDLESILDMEQESEVQRIAQQLRDALPPERQHLVRSLLEAEEMAWTTSMTNWYERPSQARHAVTTIAQWVSDRLGKY